MAEKDSHSVTWAMQSEACAPPPPRSEAGVELVRPAHTGARVTVLLQPDDRRLSLPRPKTARQLLEALGLGEECALVARDSELLTPDRRIWPDDHLLVRVVMSAG